MKNAVREKAKKAALLTSMLLAAVVGSSCDLNEDTSGLLGPESFYETRADFEASLMPMYRYFSDGFRFAQGQLVSFAGDDKTAHPGGNKGPFRGYDLYNYSADANWLGQWSWTPPWNTIHSANEILDNLEEADLDQSFKNEISAQARFMRGLSYYMTVRRYGGVPLLTSGESTGEESRATVLEVYNLIEEDLTFAESNLPEEWSAAGKPTSGAAKTVLASVYLTWAGWPLKDESKYALAAQKAQEVMDSGNYSLLSDFDALWEEENDINDEYIFAVQFSRSANIQTSMAQSWASYEEGGYVDGYAQIDFFERFPEGPRKEATFQTVYTTSEGETVEWENSYYGHPTYAKWVDGGELIGGRFRSGKNIPLFRYAEVLLTFAEAHNMANGGPDPQAYEAINKVRNRAGLPDLELGLSQADFQDAVIAERAWELAGEYSRWFDMVRTETVEEVATLRHPDELDLFQQPNKEKHYISPIPVEELNRNPNLVQNPDGNIIR